MFLKGGLCNCAVWTSHPQLGSVWLKPHRRVSHIHMSPHTSTHHKTDTLCVLLKQNLAMSRKKNPPSLRNLIPKCVEAALHYFSSVYIASNYMFSQSYIELSSTDRRFCADPMVESVCAAEQRGGISARGRSGRGRAPQPAHNQLGGRVDYTELESLACVCVCVFVIPWMTDCQRVLHRLCLVFSSSVGV